MPPKNTNSTALAKRLQSRIDLITTEAFGVWEEHQREGTVELIPHLTNALPALGSVNGKYRHGALLDYLTSQLRDEDEDFRSRAAEALGRVGEKSKLPEAVLTTLLECLRDRDYDVRRSAAEALGAMGEKASTPKVLNALLKCLRDERGVVRRSATKALGTLGEKVATPEVIRILGSGSLCVVSNFGSHVDIVVMQEEL